MKIAVQLILIFIIIHSAYAFSETSPKPSAKHFFQHYLDAYNEFDSLKASKHYAPEVLVSGIANSPAVMTQAQMHKLLDGFLARQKQKGIVKFEWETFQVHLLSDSLAISSSVAARYDENKRLVDRASAVMQAHLGENSWKITSLTIHDHNNVLPLTTVQREKSYAAILQSEERPESDKLRDRRRKPIEVMQFAGIQSGWTVLDLIASGGYYTEVLSHRVGPLGKVYAQNPSFILTVRDGIFNQQLTKRLAGNRLANVEQLDTELGELGLNQELDAMTMVLNYHDFYNQPENKRRSDLADMKNALKKGGLFIVIDSNAKPDKHDPQLHRINSERAKKEIVSAGFSLKKEGYFLRNPKDPLDISVFDKRIRGFTDRFVYVFEKS